MLLFIINKVIFHKTASTMKNISLLLVSLAALWTVSDAGFFHALTDSFMARHWVSDFWNQKMTTFFKGLDVDGNGELSAKDFRNLGDAVADIQGAGIQRRMKLKASLASTFEDYFKDIGGSRDQFIKAVRKMLKARKLNKWATGVLTSFFKAVDANGDSSLQENEYKTIYKGLFKDASLGDISFRNIDSNKNGELSLVEYVFNGKDFFTSEDKDAEKSKYFWGPLARRSLF